MNALRLAQSEIAASLVSSLDSQRESQSLQDNSALDARAGWNMDWLKRASAVPLLVAAVAVGGLSASAPAQAQGMDLLRAGVQKIVSDSGARESVKQLVADSGPSPHDGSIVAEGRSIIDKARGGVIDLETSRKNAHPVDANRAAVFKQSAPLLATAIVENAASMKTLYSVVKQDEWPKDQVKTINQNFNNQRDALAKDLSAFVYARKGLQEAGLSTSKEDQLITAALTNFTPAVTKIEKMEFDRAVLTASGADALKEKLIESANKAGSFFQLLRQPAAEEAKARPMRYGAAR